jgi:hypothetical protein
MNAPERTLRGYVAEVSERTEIAGGFPLPLGTNEFLRIDYEWNKSIITDNETRRQQLFSKI